jgi:adenosylcobinamide-GDP ribazoletransferase
VAAEVAAEELVALTKFTGFRAAVRFLTILPVRGGDATPGRAAAFFPLVGAILGAVGAGVYLLTAKVFPISLAALATVVFWTAISGVPSILKDSRIGTLGAIAILVSVLARWQALEYLATPRVVETMIAAQAVPRAAMVAMAWCSRPAGSGLGLGVGLGVGYALASTLSTPVAIAATAQGAAAALLCGWRPGLAMIAGSVLIVQAARAWFYRRIGGVNGDCLGLTEQLIEIFVLTMFACRSCAW